MPSAKILLLACACALTSTRFFTNAQVFDPMNYNARGDGKTDDTNAVRAALAAATANNGGEVLFDTQYIFLTGCFNVTSNIILNVKGKILASLDPNDYVQIDPLPWYGGGQDAQASGLREWQAVVHSNYASNITITGGGIIDGQGAPWWACARANLTGPPCNGVSRPNLVMLVHTTDVHIYDITLKDSPSWTTHLAYCTNVHIHNTTVLAPGDSHNTDGFDIDCSVNVLIENSYYSGGDDAIAVQSGIDYYGRTYGRPTQNVLVRKLIIGTAHGISIGSETSAGVHNITFEDIEMNGSQAGVHIKSQRGRGGLVEDVTYSNIRLKNVKYAIQLSHNYHKDLAPENATATPQLKNVQINGLVADGSEYGWFLDGIPESLIYGLTFSNIHLTNTAKLIEKCNFVLGICDIGSVSPSCPPCLQ